MNEQDPPGAYWTQSIAVALPSAVSTLGAAGVAVAVRVLPDVAVGLGIGLAGVVDGAGVGVDDGDGGAVVAALAGQIVNP